MLSHIAALIYQFDEGTTNELDLPLGDDTTYSTIVLLNLKTMSLVLLQPNSKHEYEYIVWQILFLNLLFNSIYKLTSIACTSYI